MIVQFAIHFLMTMLGFGMLILAAKLIYDIQIAGSTLVILYAMVLSAGAMFAIGFLITALARDKKISDLLCYVFYFIMIFVSGATIPREIFPETMKNISKILPMTHAVDLLQGAFRGTKVSQLWLPIVTLSIVITICTLIGMVIYRRKSWS